MSHIEGRILESYPPHGIFVVVASSLLLEYRTKPNISVNRNSAAKEEERCLDRGESRVFNMVQNCLDRTCSVIKASDDGNGPLSQDILEVLEVLVLLVEG